MRVTLAMEDMGPELGISWKQARLLGKIGTFLRINATVKEGTNLLFQCKISGGPVSTWYV